MKKIILIALSLLVLPLTFLAQHTFSIVAIDPVTNEIGSAGATCLSSEDGALWISDIVLGVGAIHTQAWWTTVNQNAAHARMVAGDSPEEIISWLESNDNSSQGGSISDRQYGVVDLNGGEPRSAAYTGATNFTENGHRTGAGYSIQGNILISQDVLNDMEEAYLTTEGPLCDKLMAVMQAAKRPGADSRCLEVNISSASAFIRIAKPTDTSSAYGDLWLDLNVWLDSGTFTGDPIDELQVKFDEFKLALHIDEENFGSITIFPNPTDGLLYIDTEDQKIDKIEVINYLGQVVAEKEISTLRTELDLTDMNNGFYMVKLYSADSDDFIIRKINLLQTISE